MLIGTRQHHQCLLCQRCKGILIKAFFFHILLFTQAQWLSVVAGILFSYFQNTCTTERPWVIPLSRSAPLLFIQAFCSVLLISQMICGQFINTIIQMLGGIFLFTIGSFSYYWLPQKTSLSHITLGILLGVLILFGWQRILLHRYWSVEWCMLFFIPCICLIILATILKAVSWYWGSSKNRTHRKQYQALNLIYAGLWYILFTIITSFFSAMAFDCGI